MSPGIWEDAHPGAPDTLEEAYKLIFLNWENADFVNNVCQKQCNDYFKNYYLKMSPGGRPSRSAGDAGGSS